MIKWLPVALLCSSVPVLANDASKPDPVLLEQQAAQITQQFGGQLKTLLQASLASGGPVKAMQVCKTSAPQIAQTVSQDSGWQVARTSSKVRNPANRPDTWEQQVLAEWTRQIAQGTPVPQLKSSAVEEQDGKQLYRYMQAIPTAELCVNCHGSELAPEVKAALAELYPQDQATGFKVGDLRGAFSLQKAL